MSRNEVRRLCERRSIGYVHDRILHEGAKRCEGTSDLYTVGCQGSLSPREGREGRQAGIRDI